jgi:hypothetical protein
MTVGKHTPFEYTFPLVLFPVEQFTFIKETYRPASHCNIDFAYIFWFKCVLCYSSTILMYKVTVIIQEKDLFMYVLPPK